MDRDKMSNLHRGPSIDASYQVSVVVIVANRSGRNEQTSQRTFHRCFLPSFGSFGQAVSEEKMFKNRPIRNKNCLWQPCLLMDRGKNQQSLERSFHGCFLPSFTSFQRRRLKCEKLTDDGRQVMTKAHIAFGKVS